MMKMNSIRKKLSFILCIVLIAAMALFTAGCNDASGAPSGTAAPAGTAFTVVVTDLQGEQTTFHYTSDKDTVGDALLAEGLIAGEDSDYGLYVTTVKTVEPSPSTVTSDASVADASVAVSSGPVSTKE